VSESDIGYAAEKRVERRRDREGDVEMFMMEGKRTDEERDSEFVGKESLLT
jgi:hypothetical protein